MQIFEPLNIAVALVDFKIFTGNDEFTITNSSDDTLRNFLDYRRRTLLRERPHDVAHLVT